MFPILSSPEDTELLRLIPGIRRGLWDEHKFWKDAYASGSGTRNGKRVSIQLYSTRKGFCLYDYEKRPGATADDRLCVCGCLKCIRNKYPKYAGDRDLLMSTEMDRICGTVVENKPLY